MAFFDTLVMNKDSSVLLTVTVMIKLYVVLFNNPLYKGDRGFGFLDKGQHVDINRDEDNFHMVLHQFLRGCGYSKSNFMSTKGYLILFF